MYIVTINTYLVMTYTKCYIPIIIKEVITSNPCGTFETRSVTIIIFWLQIIENVERIIYRNYIFLCVRFVQKQHENYVPHLFFCVLFVSMKQTFSVSSSFGDNNVYKGADGSQSIFIFIYHIPVS